MPRPKIFKPPRKSALLALYKDKTDSDIALIYGCSTSVIKKWRQSLGISGIRRHGDGIGAPQKFDRPPPNKLRMLTETKTDHEIAAIYGCSRRAIGKWREAYGIEKTGVVYRRRPWARDLDEGFFDKINSEKKAYILGLLATDGCVANGKSHSNRVFLCLQERDEHILQEVLKAMRSTSSVLRRPKGSFPGSGPMRYIAFSSRRLVSDLAKWGVVPRKSANLAFTELSHRFERHYIRGLFDGDGSIHPGIFYFLGTEMLIDGVIAAVYRHTRVRMQKRKAGRLFRASGYKGSAKVLHWMYRGSTIFLNRKRKIYEEYFA